MIPFLRCFALCFCLLLASAMPSRADDVPQATDFKAFIAQLKVDPAVAAFKPETIDVLDSLQPVDHVVELDRRQPEFTLTYARYSKSVITSKRVAQGRKLVKAGQLPLVAIGKKYGVQPRFIVALWAIESGYGQSMGSYSVLDSLATLAWEGRRAEFFRKELIAALTIVDHGDVSSDKMTGSWAGAMGQCQFMPSTFLKYAQDWDGDGKRDIWHDRADALASTANYLSKLGWNSDIGWGRPVKVPAGFDPATLGLDVRKPLKEWARLGVRAQNGGKLTGKAEDLSLIYADKTGGPAFLVNSNFRALMTWNRSYLFALTVGHLADAIGHR